VLAVLYNNARIRGLHGFNPRAYVAMTGAEAHQLLEGMPELRFGIVNGHLLDLDLSDEREFDPSGYDRRNSMGSSGVMRVLRLRREGGPGPAPGCGRGVCSR
jgi:hypothetical protein